MPAIIPLAIAAGSAVLSKQQQDKAAKAQQQAQQASQVNIPAIDAQARQTAQQNAVDSAALEAKMTPEVPQLRTQANLGVMNALNDTSLNKSESMLNSKLGVPLNSPLLQAAIAKAHSDLSLGGQLPQDVQNLVTRTALAHAGTAAPGQLNLGRDLNTRDLGLTSLQLSQQRLQNASQLGGQELGMANDNSNNLLNQVQLLRAIHDSRFSNNLAAAQYGQSINRPVVGLDPGAIANLSVGNSNANAAALSNTANIRGQQGQNYAGLAGQALGYGLLKLNNQPAFSTPSTGGYGSPYTPPSTPAGSGYGYGGGGEG